MKSSSNLHDGHRQRMFERFDIAGFQDFQEHEILEMMLFYPLCRVNTNEIAHRLLNEFGSLSAVCNAPTFSLLKIPGLGMKTIRFLHSLSEFVRAFEISTVNINKRVLERVDQAVEIMAPYFIGLTVEKLYVMVLDSANRILSISLVSEGSQDATEINLRRIIDVVISIYGSKIILAHNHPGSVALPSQADAIETLNLRKMLKCIHIQLVEHIVYSSSVNRDSDYDSLMLIKSGYIDSFTISG